jgi:putative oxidoreductase
MNTADSPRVSCQDRAFNIAFLVLRIAIGVIMVAHGGQKLFSLFGGHGLAATIQYMGPIGILVGIGEFFGGLGIALGFLTRFSALALIVTQVGAIAKVHWANGFFLGGPKPGFEYNLSLIAILIALLIAGPGKYALIRLFEYVIPVLKKVNLFIE